MWGSAIEVDGIPYYLQDRSTPTHGFGKVCSGALSLLLVLIFTGWASVVMLTGLFPSGKIFCGDI